MNEQIEAIKRELKNDSMDELQDFISFRTKERLAVSELKKLLGISKAMAIAVACSYMISEIKKIEAKQNGKK